LLSAQAAVFQPAVDFLFLGAQWVDVPKFPGDFGLLKLSFFLADQHVDVSVSLSRCGLYAEPVRSPSAGPGVYEAILKVRADSLGVSEGCTAVFRSRHVYKSGALSGGVEKVEYAEVYVPPYPSPRVAAVGGLTSATSLPHWRWRRWTFPPRWRSPYGQGMPWAGRWLWRGRCRFL
jgi:hypothetical protein